jgi:hypothetical protein
MKDERLLELAISGLEAQRKRIEEELAQLTARVRGVAQVLTGVVAPATKTKRRKMSAAKRKALSEKMKKSWAARRAKK